ncbi:NAD(P)-dependent dehydrogenase (short-subunit alcohol dehydrogenase family) [Phyllobacterium myrsinacearum]|uniref:NAD(P)-dependent dehydrogenase (Short-subunit alcohol dehydrogenase family) n=1 Tax=Phyllobacterium myrsinacearum TaxID=28101 RepID=A0A839ERF9_9HYPH|nr:nucleotidyl transferase AbiEii/AbiGii toxin family protein [Phyllobacterium myrsinacearum]MBA8879190.1 NAD(P)-dependent dehydrogenase (short-subunit alcohol dehydrogenase family) [Phyllobacterium myrsinacearum]
MNTNKNVVVTGVSGALGAATSAKLKSAGWNIIGIDRIREELEYGGVRLRTTASISGARVGLIIDIGFGDATEPGAEMLDYPSMLEFPAPRLRA